MRWLIPGTALSAVTVPALAAGFTLASTDVKSGSPMALAQALIACKGQNISPALSWSGDVTANRPCAADDFATRLVD